MRGSEKINPSKYIKEATLELTLWGGFFVLCYNVVIESARYSTEPSASDWDISKSLINHLLMRQEKTCF